MTLLQIVNRIQRRMRMPESADLTDSHAKLLLEFVNDAQQVYLTDGVDWDELIKYVDVAITGDSALATVTAPFIVDPTRYEIDTILHLKDADGNEVFRKSPKFFERYKDQNPYESDVALYKQTARTESTISIELCATPSADATYTAMIKIVPPELSAQDDVPLLPARVIIKAALMLAKVEEGRATQEEAVGYIKALATVGIRRQTEGITREESMEEDYQ